MWDIGIFLRYHKIGQLISLSLDNCIGLNCRAARTGQRAKEYRYHIEVKRWD
jgi:hypothetical protein